MTTGSNPDRSATGATLSASFTGETGAISETGFYYGTSSGSLGNRVSSGSISSPFSKAITGLTAGTTYYYKAYVVEYNESTSSTEERLGGVESFTTKKVATAVVITKAPTGVGATTATFNGSFSGASGTVSDHGFYYKKTTDSEWQVVHLNGTGSSGTFTASVSNLEEDSTYQVKAFVEENNENTGVAEHRFGDVETFTTFHSTNLFPAYLDDYGIPDVSGILNGTGESATYISRGDHWFRYNTTNNNRQIAVHTYTHPDTSEETVNYVVMYDGSRYAPVWTAHTMNTTYWPDKGVTRSNDWGTDPAISLTQIDGLNDNSTYSRGHLVASSYRKSTDDQNAQTFYNTNKAPQYQTGFNQGVWSDLEDRVKAIAPSGNSTMLYVVTGVLYEGTLTYMPKGSYSVPIPSHFYKCIMKCTFNGSTVASAQGIAFVYTNESHSGESYYKTGQNGFVTSIDAIEERAGFDFFAKVPDSLESGAESNTDHRWFTGASNINSVSENNWGNF